MSSEVGLGEMRSVVTGVRSVVRVMWSVHRVRTVVVLSTTVLLGVLPVAVLVSSAVAISTIGEIARLGMSSDAGIVLERALVLLVALFVLRSVVTYGGGYLARFMARQVDGELRERTIRAATGPAGVWHLEDPELLRAFDAARNLSPLGMTPGMAVQSFGVVVASRLEPIGYAIVLTVLWWPLGLAMLAIAAVGHMEMHRLLMTQIRQAFIVESPTEAFYFRDLAINPDAAKDVRVFGLGPWLTDRYRTSMLGFLERSWKRRALFGWSFFVVFVITGATIAGGMVHFAVAAAHGDISTRSSLLGLSALLLLAPRVIPEDIQVAYGANAVPAILAAESAAAALASNLPGDLDPADAPRHAVRFEDVSFRYPGSDTDVLRGLNLELRAGERTALVGVNGAGKTSIVKLLCRLYEPTSGTITVDGVDLAELDAARWQRKLAVLFQDFVRYELTAADNVRFGAVDFARAGASPATACATAAARVGADVIVDNLPAGWDTTLSGRYADGVDLSGGQWQRIAFARAFFAVEAGARLLVLDEPTANLDVRAEAELYDQFIDLTARGRDDAPLTTVLVSHRLSTVRRADRIVVLDGGCVVEDGAHDELLALGGIYARMFRAQAARFAEASADSVEATP